MTYKRLGNGDYTGGSPSIIGTVLVGNFGEGKDLVARCKEMHFAPLTADYASHLFSPPMALQQLSFILIKRMQDLQHFTWDFSLLILLMFKHFFIHLFIYRSIYLIFHLLYLSIYLSILIGLFIFSSFIFSFISFIYLLIYLPIYFLPYLIYLPILFVPFLKYAR